MNKRGIIITLDSLVAFFIVISIASIVLATVSGLSFSGQDSLAQTSQQVLFVAEQTGILDPSVSATEKREFLNETLPARYCGVLSLFDEIGDYDFNVTKDGCEDNAEEQGVALRAFIDAPDIYYASLRVWLQ